MATLNRLDRIILKNLFGFDKAVFLSKAIDEMDELNKEWDEPGTELSVPEENVEIEQLDEQAVIALQNQNLVHIVEDHGYRWIWVDRVLVKKLINDYKRSVVAHIKPEKENQQ